MEKVFLPESYRAISAFLTLRCNLDCSFCLNKKSNKNFNRTRFKEISGEEWVTALNRLETKVETPLVISGGEPSLHKDFTYILNNIKNGLKINLLTNLNWSEEKIRKFIREVSPDKIPQFAPYPSIRASYHPEQVKEGELLIKNAMILKKEGFSIGIEAVMYPNPFHLEAIERMAIKCRNNDLSFRVKSFMGVYEGEDDLGKPFSIKHGTFLYPDAIFQEKTKKCLCKTHDFIINPQGDLYQCQRDLLHSENSLGNLVSPEFKIPEEFKSCDYYGKCHPCDVKYKTTPDQKSYYASVEIKDIKE